MQCTPAIKLYSTLHVPTFPVNLVSLGALGIILDKVGCSIQEQQTGRQIGAGTRRRGLWYMDREENGQTSCSVFAAVVRERETKAMINHCRMGHVF